MGLDLPDRSGTGRSRSHLLPPTASRSRLPPLQRANGVSLSVRTWRGHGASAADRCRGGSRIVEIELVEQHAGTRRVGEHLGNEMTTLPLTGGERESACQPVQRRRVDHLVDQRHSTDTPSTTSRRAPSTWSANRKHVQYLAGTSCCTPTESTRPGNLLAQQGTESTSASDGASAGGDEQQRALGQPAATGPARSAERPLACRNDADPPLTIAADPSGGCTWSESTAASGVRGVEHVACDLRSRRPVDPATRPRRRARRADRARAAECRAPGAVLRRCRAGRRRRARRTTGPHHDAQIAEWPAVDLERDAEATTWCTAARRRDCHREYGMSRRNDGLPKRRIRGE